MRLEARCALLNEFWFVQEAQTAMEDVCLVKIDILVSITLKSKFEQQSESRETGDQKIECLPSREDSRVSWEWGRAREV